jgi:hypothetical protein
MVNILFVSLYLNFLFFRKNNVKIVLSCFFLFLNKETKDYDRSPRSWTYDPLLRFYVIIISSLNRDGMVL